MRVIDPWEEHCTECGEPECYGTCPKFQRAATGRCARFERGIEWRMVDGRWVRVVAFREWAKLELLWHGRMAGERAQRFFEWLDRVVGPAMCALRVFRWWRSLRWRLGKWIVRRGEAPSVWRVVCTAQNDCALMASVATAAGDEVFRAPMPLKAGERREFEWPLPKLEEGALVRVIAAEGSNGEVVFERLELSSPSSTYSNTSLRPLRLCDSALKKTHTSVKVVAWDLDGTVWDGILAEDGVEGVRVKPEVLALVEALDRRGVVSSIVSKNDRDAALAALKAKGIEEWFVFPQISWDAKSIALKRLAKEMNVGLDSIAFVDDTEHERQEVAAELPEVRVYERLTEDDVEGWGDANGAGCRRRVAYREEMERRSVQAHDFAGDAAAFLAASELMVELVPVEGAAVARCRELVQRTNQLNLTARRYGEAEFAELLRSATCVAVKAHDKYGDYGVVGFVARRERHIVECCFSCRIAGKGVEKRVLSELAAGGPLTADVVATERNGKIREIVEELGIGF